MTCYCRKCKRDMPVGEICPQCGGKLGQSAVRVKWEVWHNPLTDWISWNAVARILLPAFALVAAGIPLAEGLAGGAGAAQRLLQGGFLLSMAVLLAVVILIALLLLALRGKDIEECVVDSRGVHIRRFVPEPTPLRLIARFRSPELLQSGEWDETETAVLTETAEIRWADIARVQLWREKGIVLFYAPHWWMRLAIHCTPFTWSDTLEFMRSKVGRKKNLLLPPELVAPPKPRAPKAPKPASAPFRDKDDDPGIPAAVLAELKDGDN